MRMTRNGWCSCFAVGVVLSACTFDSPTYIQTAPDDKVKAQSTSATAGASTCDAPFVKPDVAKLPACGDGKGHCYAKTKTPAAEVLGPCPDASTVCVPDELLKAGGDKLKSCNVAALGAPGACIT